jgi:hypothetical protein
MTAKAQSLCVRGKHLGEVFGEIVLSAEETKAGAGNHEKRIDIIFDFLKEAMP